MKEDFKFTDEEIKVSETQDERICYKFKGGETEGLKRLEDYCKKALRHYNDTRNNLIGADYSSKLSPWLANGSLSIKKVFKAASE